MRVEKKLNLLQRRRWRIRRRVSGTPERPRMSVRFTQKNIYVQFVDDTRGVTLAVVSTVSKSLEDRDKLAANVPSAKRLGAIAAAAALGQGIKQVVFDRSGSLYHGKVKALADAAREAGLQL